MSNTICNCLNICSKHFLIAYSSGIVNLFLLLIYQVKSYISFLKGYCLLPEMANYFLMKNIMKSGKFNIFYTFSLKPNFRIDIDLSCNITNTKNSLKTFLVTIIIITEPLLKQTFSKQHLRHHETIFIYYSHYISINHFEFLYCRRN
jgi:hypothetical protein